MLEASLASAPGTTTHRFTASKPRWAHGNGEPPLGAPRIHGELLKLGFAVSERTVSRYLPDRTRGRSQTWRTFLTNHVGDLMYSSAVASSELPGDDDVVDTGLVSFGATPTSGIAGRLQPRRDHQLRSFGSTQVPSLAGFHGPTFTTAHGQASSGRDPPIIAGATGHTHTRGDAFVRRCRFVPAARTASGDRFAMRLGSLSGNSGTLRVRPAPLMWRHGADTSRSKRATASVPMSDRNFGEDVRCAGSRGAVGFTEGSYRPPAHWLPLRQQVSKSASNRPVAVGHRWAEGGTVLVTATSAHWVSERGRPVRARSSGYSVLRRASCPSLGRARLSTLQQGSAQGLGSSAHTSRRHLYK
jgi:hypothetical protein